MLHRLDGDSGDDGSGDDGGGDDGGDGGDDANTARSD